MKKRMAFKVKTVVLSALQVSGCNQYGNTAKRTETAPVPVGDVRNRQKSSRIENGCIH
jgi:hypothetical protein